MGRAARMRVGTMDLRRVGKMGEDILFLSFLFFLCLVLELVSSRLKELKWPRIENEREVMSVSAAEYRLFGWVAT